MHMYLTVVPLDLETMFCMSCVESAAGELPEMSAFKIVPPDEVLALLSPRKRQWVVEHVLPHLPG